MSTMAHRVSSSQTIMPHPFVSYRPMTISKAQSARRQRLVLLMLLSLCCALTTTTAEAAAPYTKPSSALSMLPSNQVSMWWNENGGSSDNDDDDEEIDENESDVEEEEEAAEPMESVCLAPALDANNSNVSPEGAVERNVIYNSKVETKGSSRLSELTHARELESSFNEAVQQEHHHQSSAPPKATVSIPAPDPAALSSQSPLQTLQRLQQMLDDTDYRTKTVSRTAAQRLEALVQTNELNVDANSPRYPQLPSQRQLPEQQLGSHSDQVSHHYRPLWTSQDRRKYKQQQREQQQLTRSSFRAALPSPPFRPPPPPPMQQLDDEEDDTDDGLGYTLPNLPVYWSDAEDEGDEVSESLVQTTLPPPPPPLYESPPWNGKPAWTQQLVPQHGHSSAPLPLTCGRHDPGWQHPNVPPPSNVESEVRTLHSHGPQQHQQHQHVPPQTTLMPIQDYAYGHTTYTDNMPPQFPPPPQGQVYARSNFVPRSPMDRSSSRTASFTAPESRLGRPVVTSSMVIAYPGLAMVYRGQNQALPPQSLAEASSRLSFASIQKLCILLVTVALACYAGVSPHTLPLSLYNLAFYENLRIVSLALLAPTAIMLSVLNARENDINSILHSTFVSFTAGYLLTFGVEIVLTTVVRLAVFSWLEPSIFALSPGVPLPILPWVLRELRYRPKRITLFAADFVTSCLACPIIEEYVKLRLLQWSVTLPRNFNWVTKKSVRSKKKRRVAEAIMRWPMGQEVINSNCYVSQMLAVSMGLKLCDAFRRILLYSKPYHADKSFYAICRGIFPIQELCGTMTALALAKRDLLGVDMPLWKLLAPAVVVHGMANFRGVKPIFKWNSSTPWSEMQLSPFNVPDSSTLQQLLSKGFAKLMWLVILTRVLGYCIKNYYMINRQAVKRCTTYAGKHSAFSAELVTAEVLKTKK